MSCPDQNELGVFAEGGLSAEKRGEIQQHLDGCSDCFTLVVELAKMGASSAPDEASGYDFSSDDTLGSVDGQMIAALQGDSRFDEPIDLLGQTIDGRYRVDRLIGKGGFAEVYRCRQLSVGRDVAIKVLTTDLTSQDEIVRRFEAEAKIVSRLKHPNTLKLYDFGRTKDGRLYIVIELLSGQPIDQVLRGGPIDQIRLAVWLKQICGAIQEAHDEGIFHRDLKPSNLYLETLSGDDFVKVLDFGIAKVADTKQTTSGIIMGTPSYMSPEQVEARAIDHRTDLYSLGVIAYEALTGQAPFTGDTPVSVMYKHANQVAPDVRQIKDDTHPAIAHLIGMLLKKDPGQRPPTAASIIDYLERVDWATAQVPAFHNKSTQPDMGPFSHSVREEKRSVPPSSLLNSVNSISQTPSAPTPTNPHLQNQMWGGESGTQSGSWMGPPPRQGLPLGWVAFGILAAAVGGFWLAQSGKPNGELPQVPVASQNQTKVANASTQTASKPVDARPKPVEDSKGPKADLAAVAEGAPARNTEQISPKESAKKPPSESKASSADVDKGRTKPAVQVDERRSQTQKVAKKSRSQTQKVAKKTASRAQKMAKRAASKTQKARVKPQRKPKLKKSKRAALTAKLKAKVTLSPKRATYSLTDTPRARLTLSKPDGSKSKSASIKWAVKPSGRARIDGNGRVRFLSEGVGTITGCSGLHCSSVKFYAESDE